MTTAEAEVPVEPRRARRWPWLVGVLVIVAVAVTTIVLVRAAVRDEGYGPLVSGAAYGTDGPGWTSDGDGHRLLRANSGPAYVLAQLDNEGAHDVRVAGIESNRIIRAAQWAPLGPPSEVVLRPKQWREFPAVVPAVGTVQVRLTIGQPDSCRHVEPGDGGTSSFSGGYDVRWQSRRSEHVTAVDGDFADSTLQLC